MIDEAHPQPDPEPPRQPLSAVELEALCAAGTRMECEAGRVLFERGEEGDSMYVLEEGRVALSFADGTPEKFLGSGALFGELALVLGHHPRSATATTATPTRLLIVDGGAVERLFQAEPRILAKLLRYTCSYLLRSEERLIGSLRRKNEELGRALDYLRRTREELGIQELKAQTDELTGLYNRRCFDTQLPKFIDRAASQRTGVVLLLLDLDNFKAVNDTCGHQTGDQVLRAVGGVLASAVRSSDLPCRFGGDEFALVLTQIPAGDAHERAEEIKRRVNEAATTAAGPRVPVTASVGGTLLLPGESASELFARADRLLYRAKNQGRDQVAFSTEGTP